MANASTTQMCQWLDQFAGGDERALHQLLTHCEDRLRAVARRAKSRRAADGPPMMETDDLLQETAIRLMTRCEAVCRNLANVAVADRAKFFFGCTARCVRDVLCEDARKAANRQRRRAGQGMSPADLAPDAGFDGDDEERSLKPLDHSNVPDRILMWAEFHEFVNSLPDPLRQVADLHWYQGLTHAEVGEVLGVAEVTSRSRWAQARVKIVQRFPETPFEWAS